MTGFEDILKQAGGFQKKIEEMKTKVESSLHEGSSGGGMVKVVMNGKGLVKSIDVDKALISPEEKTIMEDLIIAALNDAKNKADIAMQNMMSEAAGNLPFKMPF